MKCPVIYDAQTKIWSHPYKILPPKICLGQVIMQKLDQNDPNQIIEVNYDNGEKLTSGQLKSLIICAAQNLLNLGIKKGDIVLFFSSMNSLTTPIIFACYTIGAAIFPMQLNLGDDATVGIVGKLNPTIILYDRIFETRVKSTIKKVNLSNLKYVLSFESRNDGKSVTEMLCSPIKSNQVFEAPDLGDPDKLVAGLFLTSGTTGLPKVVCISHTQIFLSTNDWWATNSNSVVFVVSGLRWMTQVSVMLVPITGNCSRAFSGQDQTPERCLDLIKSCGVTNIFAIARFITNIFLIAEKQQNCDALKSLRYVFPSGERISTVLDKLVKNLTPNCTFLRGYGMTELAGTIASTVFESLANNMECGNGYIVQGFSLKIIDDNKNSLGPNQNGQICVKRVAPHLKYYKNDKANAESYSNDGDWLLTGDYGKVDNENFLHVYNRCKDLIKCGQDIIIPSILEKHLDEHPAIESNYVIGIPDSSKGEIPIVCIKLNSNASNWNSNQLKNNIKNYLTEKCDELLPQKIYFVENLPYTPCGKIDRMQFKEWILKKNFENS